MARPSPRALPLVVCVLALLAALGSAHRGRGKDWKAQLDKRQANRLKAAHPAATPGDVTQVKPSVARKTGRHAQRDRRELSTVFGGWSETTCFGDPKLEEEFLGLYLDPDGDPLAGGGPVYCIPDVGVGTPEECDAARETFGKGNATNPSCCMYDACVLPCPVPVEDPDNGYIIVISVFMAIFCAIGIATYMVVKGQSVNFFVAGRSLPGWVVTMTLASQSIDSNALLGNADLAHYYNLWDGAVLPIGLGISLILNGVFLAAKINQENVLTLPDVYAHKYGKAVEIAASVCLITSFLMLLAGNLVGMGVILEYLSPVIGEEDGVWVAGLITIVYTACGGLYSVAYTDCVQSAIGWTGCLVCAFWILSEYGDGASMQRDVQPESTNGAPPVSIGFGLPFGYVYPDGPEDGGACDMYNGTSCTNVPDACCYNEAFWSDANGPTRIDNGAYPVGDEQGIDDYMTDKAAYYPFPNAIVFNWATIFVLGFGNLAALDFQARCMAAKTPQIATYGCIIAGFLTFLVGIPWAYVGGVTRYFYGPDSIHAEFAPDSCNKLLMLPTCGLWVPEPKGTVMLLTHQVPGFLGGWALIGMVAASMSTSDGAILAMGTVLSHNILRHFMPSMPDATLLNVARVATVPFGVLGVLIAAYADINHSAGTGYLLIVAFDIAFASCVVTLFAGFYVKDPSPTAAFLSICIGALTRFILEFALPKDGSLIYPFDGDEYIHLDSGAGANSFVPGFTDMPDLLLWNGTHVDESNWPGNPDEAPYGVGPEGAADCPGPRYEDYTGVDSLVSPVVSLFVFVVFHALDKMAGVKLPESMGLTPYKKFDESGQVIGTEAEKPPTAE